MHDDEEMLQKRLRETPSGLKELFHHMFLKIDKVHREYLRIYCHLLKWASERTMAFWSDYNSLSLVTAVLHSGNISSPQHLIELCAICEQRIVGQSQGLIDISGRFYEESAERGLWSLGRVADQGVLQSRSHVSDDELFRHSDREIRWVHRSAHDCIFGEPGETIAPWIFAGSDLDLRKKTADCLVRNTEHLRTVSVWWYEEHDLMLETSLVRLSQDIIPLTTHDEGYATVGTLHELIVCAFPGRNRSECRQDLQSIGPMKFSIPLELQPLVAFWQGVLKSERCSYLDYLSDKPFAAMVYTGILSDTKIVDEALTCRFLDSISQDFQLWTDGNTSSNEFMHNRQFGFRECKWLRSATLEYRIILSWLGTRDRDEADVMHCLAAHLLEAPEDSSRDQSRPRVAAMLEARDICRGPQAVDEGQNLLPLQFLLPNSGFMQWWQTCNTSALLPTDHPSHFRLVCVHRKERIKVSPSLQQQLTFQPRVVAIFDMTATSTALLLSQKTVWTPSSRDPFLLSMRASLGVTWLKAPADYSSCLQAVLDDIWANCDHQLDAWQQLYVLACVKVCFQRMWKVGSEAEVAEWMEPEERGYFSVLSPDIS